MLLKAMQIVAWSTITEISSKKRFDPVTDTPLTTTHSRYSRQKNFSHNVDFIGMVSKDVEFKVFFKHLNLFPFVTKCIYNIY
jgi:hypothetical protein